MRRLVVMVALVGCGRVGFDPTPGSGPGDDGGGGSGGGDGGGASDGSITGGDAPMPDAQPAACATAMTVQAGTPIAISTCAGNNDRFDGCGPNSTFEVVFKFFVPATGTYTVRAFDAGTMNISNTTGRLNAGCTTTTTCTGVLQTTFTSGTIEYFVVEASSGGCTNIEFDVM
ncbi:MAG TPA: hypothetical protein VIV11_28720 [Kofleriaceae bacterium]